MSVCVHTCAIKCSFKKSDVVKQYLDFFTFFSHSLCIFNNVNSAFVNFIISSVSKPIFISLIKIIKTIFITL